MLISVIPNLILYRKKDILLDDRSQRLNFVFSVGLACATGAVLK